MELPFRVVDNTALYNVDNSPPDELISTISNNSGVEAVPDTADNILFES